MTLVINPVFSNSCLHKPYFVRRLHIRIRAFLQSMQIVRSWIQHLWEIRCAIPMRAVWERPAFYRKATPVNTQRAIHISLLSLTQSSVQILFIFNVLGWRYHMLSFQKHYGFLLFSKKYQRVKKGVWGFHHRWFDRANLNSGWLYQLYKLFGEAVQLSFQCWEKTEFP